MSRTRLASSKLHSVLLVLFVGCGGPQLGGPEPVSIGAWCQHVGETLCSAMTDRCFGGAGGIERGCVESFGPGCIANRDPEEATGRTYDDLGACTDLIRSRECNELGFDIGQASSGTGPFAELCTLPSERHMTQVSDERPVFVQRRSSL